MRVFWFAALLVASVPALGQVSDLRSVELLDYDCSSEVGRRQLTLFGNGTLRLRTWEGDEPPEMTLQELEPGELRGYRNRFREIDFSETESGDGTAAGDWVERCDLRMAFDRDPEVPILEFSFGGYDSLSLSLSRAVRIAEELVESARLAGLSGNLPHNYVPLPGDVLRRRDEALFEVIDLTGDGKGVELRGIDQPLVIYVLLDKLPEEFGELVERRDGEP